jgi:D-serine deaminase-like pyridoxal phosphate-dependent protein
VTRAGIDGDIGRHRLHARLTQAVGDLPEQPVTPTVVVDLDAFDANARDLARRAAGMPIRVASKSLRVPALITRALAAPGFSGILTYSLREALWLHRQSICADLVMGYPSVDRGALRDLVRDPEAARSITIMVDDSTQLDLVDAVRNQADPVSVRVAIDIDAGYRLAHAHVGPKRSPLYGKDQVLGLAREIARRPGFDLRGVMTYEGQVAGVQDDQPGRRARSLVVRRLKAASIEQIGDRRREIAEALRGVVDLEFWNAGGSGSIESSSTDPVVTEVTAGSGLLVPTLFDGFRNFEPRPAAYFGLRVVRRPSPGCVTVGGGGLISSGPSGKDRSPLPWAPPGLRLTALEGAGEVQTPLVGPGADSLSIGDLVWFRHGKSGELAEHTATVHLLSGSRITDHVPTYRGAGHTW